MGFCTSRRSNYHSDLYPDDIVEIGGGNSLTGSWILVDWFLVGYDGRGILFVAEFLLSMAPL